MNILTILEAKELSKTKSEIGNPRMDKYADYLLSAFKQINSEVNRYYWDMMNSKERNNPLIKYLSQKNARDIVKNETFKALQLIFNRNEIKELAFSTAESKNLFIAFFKLSNLFSTMGENYLKLAELYNDMADINISIEDEICPENRIPSYNM